MRVKGQRLARQDTTKSHEVRRRVLPQFAVSPVLDRSVNDLPAGITTRHYVETADLAPDVSDVLQRFSE